MDGLAKYDLSVGRFFFVVGRLVQYILVYYETKLIDQLTR